MVMKAVDPEFGGRCGPKAANVDRTGIKTNSPLSIES